MSDTAFALEYMKYTRVVVSMLARATALNVGFRFGFRSGGLVSSGMQRRFLFARSGKWASTAGCGADHVRRSACSRVKVTSPLPSRARTSPSWQHCDFDAEMSQDLCVTERH